MQAKRVSCSYTPRVVLWAKGGMMMGDDGRGETDYGIARRAVACQMFKPPWADAFTWKFSGWPIACGRGTSTRYSICLIAFLK